MILCALVSNRGPFTDSDAVGGVGWLLAVLDGSNSEAAASLQKCVLQFRVRAAWYVSWYVFRVVGVAWYVSCSCLLPGAFSRRILREQQLL